MRVVFLVLAVALGLANGSLSDMMKCSPLMDNTCQTQPPQEQGGFLLQVWDDTITPEYGDVLSIRPGGHYKIKLSRPEGYFTGFYIGVYDAPEELNANDLAEAYPVGSFVGVQNSWMYRHGCGDAAVGHATGLKKTEVVVEFIAPKNPEIEYLSFVAIGVDGHDCFGTDGAIHINLPYGTPSGESCKKAQAVHCPMKHICVENCLEMCGKSTSTDDEGACFDDHQPLIEPDVELTEEEKCAVKKLLFCPLDMRCVSECSVDCGALSVNDKRGAKCRAPSAQVCHHVNKYLCESEDGSRSCVGSCSTCGAATIATSTSESSACAAPSPDVCEQHAMFFCQNGPPFSCVSSCTACDGYPRPKLNPNTCGKCPDSKSWCPAGEVCVEHCGRDCFATVSVHGVCRTPAEDCARKDALFCPASGKCVKYCYDCEGYPAEHASRCAPPPEPHECRSRNLLLCPLTQDCVARCRRDCGRLTIEDAARSTCLPPDDDTCKLKGLFFCYALQRCVTDCNACPGYPEHTRKFTCAPPGKCRPILPYFIRADNEKRPYRAIDGDVETMYDSAPEHDQSIWMLFGSVDRSWQYGDLGMCKGKILLGDRLIGMDGGAWSFAGFNEKSLVKHGHRAAKLGLGYDCPVGELENDIGRLDRDDLTVDIPEFAGQGLKITSHRKKFQVAEILTFVEEEGLCLGDITSHPIAAKTDVEENKSTMLAIDGDLSTYYSAIPRKGEESRLWVLFDFLDQLLCGTRIQLAKTHIGDKDFHLDISIWNRFSGTRSPAQGDNYIHVKSISFDVVTEYDLDIRIPSFVGAAVMVSTGGQKLDIAEVSLCNFGGEMNGRGLGRLD
eukprot:TRINITY_DN76097_c0_g1_i1.p1 TRINITY_DN76097_c0_g1~~TRINITY_DN76097_c0_g1_i1.p1  ORF type:complete len:839 (+),score=102.66 TRINITY_DN76097_c0_g1_i1:32-2548(+)